LLPDHLLPDKEAWFTPTFLQNESSERCGYLTRTGMIILLLPAKLGNTNKDVAYFKSASRQLQ
jgi:hypothetical protein